MKTRNLLLALALLACSLRAHAQGTAFSYQGVLNGTNGAANGSYDFTFSLYAGSSGGGALFGPLTNASVNVNNGQFITAIDFGPGVFAGATYWLQISVRPNGTGAFN